MPNLAFWGSKKENGTVEEIQIGSEEKKEKGRCICNFEMILGARGSSSVTVGKVSKISTVSFSINHTTLLFFCN
jgi:hypothetical protein